MEEGSVKVYNTSADVKTVVYLMLRDVVGRLWDLDWQAEVSKYGAIVLKHKASGVTLMGGFDEFYRYFHKEG